LETKDLIRQHIEGADMVFVTAGQGGQVRGTGGAPVVAELLRNRAPDRRGGDQPFQFEGKKRNVQRMKASMN
jgi:cell division protein FtsZ